MGTMKNVDSILLPNEVVVYRGGFHWIIYKGGAILIFIALVFFIFAALNSTTTQSIQNSDSASVISPDSSSTNTAQTTANTTTAKKHSKKQKSSDSASTAAAPPADQSTTISSANNVFIKQVHSFAFALFIRAAFLFIVLGIVSILLNWWASSVALFIVTNKRIIMHHGIISRQSFEILLKKLESFDVDQPLFGRMLGYGTLKVRSAGSMERFPSLANPVEFRHQITIAADAAQV
jgi:hypothetical protein